MRLHLKLFLFSVLCTTFGRCEDEEPEPEQEDDGESGENPNEEGFQFDALSTEQMNGVFKKIDTNGNGKVSLAEITDFAHTMRRTMATKELTDIMTSKDKNKDGKLNLEEFHGDDVGDNPEQESAEKEVEFKGLDENSDGFVDSDELAALFHHHTNEKTEMMLTTHAMKDKDLDKNGMLSLEEFYNHYVVEDEGPPEISEEDKETFNKLDLDGSGALTLKELRAWESGSFETEQAMKKLFEIADRDHDNVVTPEELDQAKEELQAHEDPGAMMHVSQWVEHHEL